MSDTPRDIEELQIRLIAERSPFERLQMASSMFDVAKMLVVAGLLNENPSLNEAQLRARTFMRFYGDTFTRDEIKLIVQHIPNMQLDEDLL